MRETFGTLQTLAQNYCTNDTSATTLTFLKNEINRAKRFVFRELQEWVSQRTQTASSVANQQYYHLPPDAAQVEQVTVSISGQLYPLRVIDSQQYWDQLNAVTFQGTTIPKYFYMRKHDVGIWPIPQDTTWTIQLTYQAQEIDMSQSDYTTGTISVTNNSATVTGSGTSWDATFAGRWLNIGTSQLGDNYWYKISTDPAKAPTATSITLEEAYQGTTVSGKTYTIGESSDLPEETHPLFAMRAASMYWAGFKKDQKLAEYWSNMFWTEDPTLSVKEAVRSPGNVKGGLYGLKIRYASRSNDMIIYRNNNSYSTSPSQLVWGVSATW